MNNRDRVYYVPGTETSGDSGIRWFVDSGGELSGDLDSDVQLNRITDQGTINWMYWDPVIAVSDDANNTVYGHAVNPDSLVFMDNVIPVDPDTTYFEVGHGTTRDIIDPYAGIGDTITAFVDFTTMAPIESGLFDFTPLNPTSPANDAAYIIPGIIDGNLIFAAYVVQAGDIDQLPPAFPPGLNSMRQLL